MNRTQPNDEFPDPALVDQAVREAWRVDPDEAALARLARFWREESQPAALPLGRTDRPVWRHVLSAAAVLLVGVFGWSVHHSADQPPVADKVKPKIGPTPNKLLEGDFAPSTASRPPSALEIVAFYSQTRRQPSLASALPEPEPPTSEEQIAQLLKSSGPISLNQWLAVSPTADAYGLLLAQAGSLRSARLFLESLSVASEQNAAFAALRLSEHPPIDAFFVLLNDDDPLVRENAALALGHRNGPEIAQRLVAIANQRDSEHAEAWLALACCRGPIAQDFLGLAAQDPRLLGYLNAARVRWPFP